MGWGKLGTIYTWSKFNYLTIIVRIEQDTSHSMMVTLTDNLILVSIMCCIVLCCDYLYVLCFYMKMYELNKNLHAKKKLK